MRWRLAVVAAFAALIGFGALLSGRRASVALAPPPPPRSAPALPTFRPAVTAAPRLPPGVLGSGGATFSPGGAIDVPVGLRWSVEGAAATAPEPVDPLPGVEHFFLGNDPAQWRTGVPRHASALYRQLRPGMDVKVTPRAGGLALAVTATRAALRDTWFRWEGPAKAKVGEGGQLALETPAGRLTQTLEGPVRLAETRALPGGGLAYRLEAEIQPTTLPGTFQLGLAWADLLATTLGSGNAVNDAHLAPDGLVVVVGDTAASLFANAVDGGTNRGQDAYVAKFLPDAGLLWGAYLGGTTGTSAEIGEDVAFDPAGNLYVTGKTSSASFPVSAGAYQPAMNGTGDIFVTSLTPQGNAIRWSTFLGGSSSSEDGLAIGVGLNGDVWVGGYTSSGDFPLANAFDTFNPNVGGYPSADGFIAALRDGGTGLRFSSYLGGTGGLTEIYDLAVDPGSGDVYCVGDTATPNITTGTVVTPPLQPGYGGGLTDAIVLRLSGTTNPGQPLFFSYLGRDGGETINAVVADGTGAVYLGGESSSPSFPVDGGLGNTYQGLGNDAFVVKLSTSPLVGIEWSALFGGSGYDEVRAMDLAPDGALWVAGRSNSPSLRGFDGGQHGGDDAIVARLSPAGDALEWGGFLGGSANEDGRGIAVDRSGNVFVAGDTSSGDFPTTHTAASDGFLVKLDTTPPTPGTVNDGTGADVAFWASNTGVAANWSGFDDPDSPIVRYELGVSETSGQADLTGGYVDAGAQVSGVAGGLSLVDGRTYYVSVRAISSAGLVSLPATSNGFMVDGSPPPPGAVRDGPNADRRFQRPSDSLEANWDPMIDPHSGTVLYKWAIGTDAGAVDIQGYVDVGLTTSARNSTTTPVPGTRYFVTVKAVNAAGLAQTVSSDGVLVDGSPPDPGIVADGPGADVDEQPRSAPLEANWSGFADLESGITGYEYAVGTTFGGNELRDFTPVGTSTSVVASGLSLSAGAVYYVTVRATNGAGGSSTATSDGVKALGVDGDPCAGGPDCASGLCVNDACLPAGTTVVLSFSRDGGAPVHFGTRAEISADVRSIGVDLPAMNLVMSADGLALAAPDAGSATCDQGETLPVGPVAANQTLSVPVYAYVCRGPGGNPPSLTGHLEDRDGGLLTTDASFVLPVDAQTVPVGCDCASAPGTLAVAALLWAIGRRRRPGTAT